MNRDQFIRDNQCTIINKVLNTAPMSNFPNYIFLECRGVYLNIPESVFTGQPHLVNIITYGPGGSGFNITSYEELNKIFKFKPDPEPLKVYKVYNEDWK